MKTDGLGTAAVDRAGASAGAIEMPARQAEKLRHFLEHDLGKAIMFLNEAIKSIAAYAELTPSAPTPVATAAPEAASSEEQTS